MNENEWMDNYMKYAYSFSLLTVKQEKDLGVIISKFKTGKQKQDAREALINANLRLVAKYANHYWVCCYKRIPLMDLLNAGNLGLVEAVDRYDHKMNNRFSTYAVSYIKLHIFRTISSYANHVSVPSNISAQVRSYNYKKSEKADVTDEDLKKELQITEKAWRKINAANISVCSLDADYRENSTSTQVVKIKDIVADTNAIIPYQVLQSREIKTLINKTLNELNDIDKDLLQRRFYRDAENYTDIGKIYKCSGEAIRLRINKALVHFKMKLKKKVSFSELRESL